MDIFSLFFVAPGGYLLAMTLTLLSLVLLPKALLRIRRPRQRKRQPFPLMELYVVRIIKYM
jgi:hypothetical protein